MTTIFNLYCHSRHHETNRYFTDRETALSEALKASGDEEGDATVYAIVLAKLKPAELAIRLLEHSGWSDAETVIAKFRGGKKVRRKFAKTLEES
jgi:hypothetical protein